MRKKSPNLKLLSSLAYITPLVFPPRAPRSLPGPPPKCANPSFYSIKILIIVGPPFWIDFWSFWGSSWGHFCHFWRPSWIKIAPKHVLKAYLSRKREFSPDTTNSNTGELFWNPRWRPTCPKIGPRRLQEALEEQFFRSWKSSQILTRFGSDFGWFWTPFWHLSSFPRRTFFALEVDLFLACFLCHILVASKTAREAPKRPKTPPRAPQEAPRGPQERPWRLQEGLKRSQDPVKRAQDPPRSTQEAPKDTEDASDRRSRCIPKALPQIAEWKKAGGRRWSPLGKSIKGPFKGK